MKSLLSFLILTMVTFASHAENPGRAKAMAEIKNTFGMVPTFFKEFPEAGLEGAWDEFKNVQLNTKSELTPKTKELIGLAVAAQIPCRYCTVFHKRAVQFHGGSKEEMNTAIAISAIARKWSAYFNGSQQEFGAFKADIDRMTESLKSKAPQKEQVPVAANDVKGVHAQMTEVFGYVPNFVKAYPDSGIVGAWNEVRNVNLSSTVLPMKEKFLMSLGVSSQTPCNVCIYLDSEMAKANGATQGEIKEAIAVAGIVRHWSTVLNGLMQDEKTFQQEVNTMFKFLEKNKVQEKTKIGKR